MPDGQSMIARFSSSSIILQMKIVIYKIMRKKLQLQIEQLMISGKC